MERWVDKWMDGDTNENKDLWCIVSVLVCEQLKGPAQVPRYSSTSTSSSACQRWFQPGRLRAAGLPASRQGQTAPGQQHTGKHKVTLLSHKIILHSIKRK